MDGAESGLMKFKTNTVGPGCAKLRGDVEGSSSVWSSTGRLKPKREQEKAETVEPKWMKDLAAVDGPGKPKSRTLDTRPMRA